MSGTDNCPGGDPPPPDLTLPLGGSHSPTPPTPPNMLMRRGGSNPPEYYQRECSYFRNYDRTRMGRILEEANVTQLEEIIQLEVQPMEERLLAFLHSQNIPNLDTDEGRLKLTQLLESNPIEGLDLSPSRISVALCIEKFYREQNETLDHELTIEECPCPSKEAVTASSYRTGPSNKTCPSFPPALKEPVFDPCKYPHVLQLYAHFNNRCYDYRNLHGLAGAYYNRMNKKFLFPTVILSALSSITSFIASSEIVKPAYKVSFALGVGIMTSLTAMVQSFSSAYQFDSKAVAHFAAADQYDQILTEIDFEKSYPSTPNFLKELEKKILDTKSNCPYLIPNYIKKSYYNAKEQASETDFVQNKIIVPMRNELREAIASGTLGNYRFTDQATQIRKELDRLRQLRHDLEATPRVSNTCPYCPSGCRSKQKHPSVTPSV